MTIIVTFIYGNKTVIATLNWIAKISDVFSLRHEKSDILKPIQTLLEGFLVSPYLQCRETFTEQEAGH